MTTNIKSPYPLSAPEKTLGEVFNSSVQFTLNRYNADQEQRTAVIDFLVTVSSLMSGYNMLTPDSLSELRTLVFTDDVRRDFVLSLLTNFRMRYDPAPEASDGLCEQLAAAVAVTTSGDIELFPQELADRLLTEDVCQQTLIANKWVVVLVLINTYWSSTYVTAQLNKSANTSK